MADALSLAGGISRFGSPDKVTLARTWGGTSRRIPIDYDLILSGKRPIETISSQVNLKAGRQFTVDS